MYHHISDLLPCKLGYKSNPQLNFFSLLTAETPAYIT